MEKLIVLFLATLAASKSCSPSSTFALQSFSLAYYPPSPAYYTMAIAVGTFSQQTWVDKVEVSWSKNNGKQWSTYQSPINQTYVATQLIQFAPWYKLNALPRKGKHFDAIFTIYGKQNSASTEILWCWPFSIPE
jgi:hypothetical protein